MWHRCEARYLMKESGFHAHVAMPASTVKHIHQLSSSAPSSVPVKHLSPKTLSFFMHKPRKRKLREKYEARKYAE